MGWKRQLVLGGALSSLVGCAGTQVTQQETTIEPPAEVAQEGPQLMIEGGSLVLIEDGGNTPLVVYFAVDSDVIEPGLYSVLDALAVFLHSQAGPLHVQLQGHADERGSDVYNKSLSVRRAKAVERYLVERGVEPERLATTGFGEQHALHASDDSTQRRNRRVEFVIGSGTQPLSNASMAVR